MNGHSCGRFPTLILIEQLTGRFSSSNGVTGRLSQEPPKNDGISFRETEEGTVVTIKMKWPKPVVRLDGEK